MIKYPDFVIDDDDDDFVSCFGSKTGLAAIKFGSDLTANEGLVM